MLIGVLCAVVTSVAALEKEKVLVKYVKDRLLMILTELDADGSGKISKAEFASLMNMEEAKRALEDLGVDLNNLLSLSDHIFEDEEVAELDPVALQGLGLEDSEVE